MPAEAVRTARVLDIAKPLSPQTIAARDVIGKYAAIRTPSSNSFMAKSIATIIDTFNMDFRIELADEGRKNIFCYRDGNLIHEFTTPKRREEVEEYVAALPIDEQEKSRAHATLLELHKSLLYSLQSNYPKGLRLAVQQHDMLPVIAEQTWIIQDRFKSAEPTPVVSEELIQAKQAGVRQMFERIRDHAIKPYDSATSPRTLEEVRGIGPLDDQTVRTLAELRALGDSLKRQYLEDVTQIAVSPLADDPWKQSRIENSSHWTSFELIFSDGIVGQYDIIANLLTYHCYVNSVKLNSLDDALKIISDSRFLMSLRSLMGAVNEANARMWGNGYVPVDMVAKSDVPEITASGIAFLKGEIALQNQKADEHADEPWDDAGIDEQHHKRCPAAVHFAKMSPISSEIPQPGESSPFYIQHLQELEQQQPGVFTLLKGEDGVYTLTMKTEPVKLLANIYIAAIANYRKQQLKSAIPAI